MAKNIIFICDLFLTSRYTYFWRINFSASWLPKVAELLKFYDAKSNTVTVRRINVGLDSQNYRPVLRRVKLSGDTNIVLDCSIETLPEVLKQVILDLKNFDQILNKQSHKFILPC